MQRGRRSLSLHDVRKPKVYKRVNPFTRVMKHEGLGPPSESSTGEAVYTFSYTNDSDFTDKLFFIFHTFIIWPLKPFTTTLANQVRFPCVTFFYFLFFLFWVYFNFVYLFESKCGDGCYPFKTRICLLKKNK